MMNYADMTQEQLIALLQARDEEIARRDELLYGNKSMLYKQRTEVLKVTREQLATSSGISVNTLTNYETMKNAPDYIRLRQIKEVYQLTDEQFMEFINELIDDAPRKSEMNAKKKAKAKVEEEAEAEVVTENIKPRKLKKVQ
jgi:transcriptional regulator with XRE-family HTH domain